jgi:hypothetical protein
MIFFPIHLVNSLLFAACIFGTLVNKRIIKKLNNSNAIEGNQVNEPPIHVKTGSLEMSGPTIEESFGVKSYDPKWTELESRTAAKVDGENIVTNGDKNTDTKNKFEGRQSLKEKLVTVWQLFTLYRLLQVISSFLST